jgi:hypothetical protein
MTAVNPWSGVVKGDDRAFREMLRLAAEGVEGLLMRQVPAKESALDREIFSDIEATSCFRFKDPTGAFANEPITFDARMGRLDVATNIPAGKDGAGVQLVRSGNEMALMKDNDPGSEYNRRLVEIVSQVLGLGIVDEVTFGQPLPPSALLYLRPLPNPEDSCERFVDGILGALKRYKPQAIRDKKMFDTTYIKLVDRMFRSGIEASRMTPDRLQSTILEETLRAMVKVEIWRKLWRWTIDTAIKIGELRTVQAILLDQDLSKWVRDLEEAIKRAGKIVGNYAANGEALYDRAIRGEDFYVEAMPAIIYVRDARTTVEEMFVHVNDWAAIPSRVPKMGSIKMAMDAIKPQLPVIKEIMKIPVPRAVAG